MHEDPAGLAPLVIKEPVIFGYSVSLLHNNPAGLVPSVYKSKLWIILGVYLFLKNSKG